MRIVLDEDRCVSSGQCVMTAEDYFDQREDDGVAVVLREEVDNSAVDRIRRATDLCPGQALRLAN
ncbi:ferredoxin [Rhodococcoides yunnanense]|uniref:ferredoxin n=1 Tax=Rhodococcoides yunnanense TaxID=278209 RepID=UPI00093499E5|nr:ferredoxin [Rhodococcus yunnanensis]